MKHFVYILYSPVVDRYFVGRTTRLEKQLERHNSGKNSHTKTGVPWKLVCKMSFDLEQESKKREQLIKSSKSREELIGWIRSEENEIK